jgi:GH24 family phage-related lysozyme (muramidase)
MGWEACSLTPYRDAVGLWTIGWGHLMGPDEPRVPITQEEADALFADELEHFGEEVASFCPENMAQHEYDAVVAWAFNVGASAASKSTLVRMLNDLDFDAAAQQFLRWDKAGGRTILGLTKRRRAERAMFVSGDYSGRP